MKVRQVVRIEGEDGVGMFRCPSYEPDAGNRRSWIPSREINEIGSRHADFNDPYQDNIDLRLNGRKWFCSYKSVDQLKDWVMKDEIITMYSHGFRVYLIEVTEFQEGDDQICYTKESIVLKKDISELFIN